MAARRKTSKVKSTANKARTRARKTAWLARQLLDLSPTEIEQLAATTDLLEQLTTRRAAR